MSKRYPGGIIRKTPQTPSQTSAQGIWDMASVTQAVKENTWPIAGVPDPISRSLRFRSSASANLRRTPTVTSNQRTWTWSGWVKRGSLTSDQMLFSASNTYIRFGNGADDTLWLNFRGTGGTNYFFQTTQVFRDPAAWYHIVLAVDTTQATASNRVKLYSNGVQITAFTTYADYPPQNTDTAVNSTTAHTLGSYSSNTIYFDGYMTEVYLIDGQALTPSSFGNTNDQTGVWQPIAYTGTYGTNGFYLPFSNTASTSTLGNDFSGNNNNWTTNNISLTTGTSIQTFSTVGTTSWTAPTGVTSVSYLVVAGGGGGGTNIGGGGGGGGVQAGTLTVVPGASYTVTVGAGGTSGSGDGGNSVFSTITSTGGGGGGGAFAIGRNGGSGGGDSSYVSTGGLGTPGQGNNGGKGANAGGTIYPTGGGGGASAVGGDGTVGGASGNGGAGLASSISGSSVTYGGGGGGGSYNNTRGTGGSGGGGNGGTDGNAGVAGTANTGGGGGGGGTNSGAGGAGGSGIVILSWASGSTSTYDSMVDVPTQWIPYNTAGDTGALWRGNYATWNSLPAVGSTSKPTYSEGNLTVAFPSFGYAGPLSTLSLPTQNTYCEITCASVGGGGYSGVGIAELFADLSGNVVPTKCVTYGPNGGKTVSGAFSSYGSSFTTGDIIGIAYDYSGNQVTFYKNNVSQGALSLSSLSGALFFCCHATSGAITWTANFGQRPFAYAPPSGFLTLNTTNLPTPTIGTTSTTQANDYFDVVTYTGAGGTQTISGLQFQPDFIWGKARSAAYGSALFDSVRGYGSTKGLVSNLTQAEGTVSAQYGYISTNTSTGFTAAAGNDSSNPNAALNESGVTYVAWNWRANGAGSTNTAGSITSTVSANTSAGFSIVTYTGNGSNATIGHGLGVAPSMIIRKARNASAQNNWYVYHSSLSANGTVFLNLTDAYFASANYWNNTAPTSSVFTVGSATNVLNDTWVAYCFAQIAGYSAFGSYVGNDSADGTFIYTGFRPAFILYKKATGVDGWVIFDVKRNTYNVVDTALQPNTSGAEASSAAGSLDIVSNGFKQRNANNIANSSSFTYIYMAFAESPFKYALAR